MPASIDVAQVLPCHPHITTERNRTHPVVCGTALPSEEPRPETDGEHVHAHSKQTRHDKMSPFVHQDQDAQHKKKTDCYVSNVHS